MSTTTVVSRRRILEALFLGVLASLRWPFKQTSATAEVETDTESAPSSIVEATAAHGSVTFFIQGDALHSYNDFVGLAPTHRGAQLLDRESSDAAAEEIRRLSGAFVKPLMFGVRQSIYQDFYRAKFLFLGEREPDRQIVATLCLQDAAGKTLSEQSVDVTDHRIWVVNNPRPGRGVDAPINCVDFIVD